MVIGTGGSNAADRELRGLTVATSFDPAARRASTSGSCLEGMRLSVADAVAAGPTNGFGDGGGHRRGAGQGRSAGGARRRSGFGASAVPATDRFGRRLQPGAPPDRLDDANLGPAYDPDLSTGRRAQRRIRPASWTTAFGSFKQVLVTADPGTGRPAALGSGRSTTALDGDSSELSVATLQRREPRSADRIRSPRSTRWPARSSTTCSSPDIVGHARRCRTPTGRAPVNGSHGRRPRRGRRLIDAIVAAGGPLYDYRQIDPENNADGGAPGGNVGSGSSSCRRSTCASSTGRVGTRRPTRTS